MVSKYAQSLRDAEVQDQEPIRSRDTKVTLDYMCIKKTSLTDF